MSGVQILAAGASDVGKVRDQNEDGIHVDDELGFYAVADGVGGHAAGEVASALAVEASARSVRAWRAAGSSGPLIDAARAAVEAACAAVHERAIESRAHRGMATTLTLVIVEGERAVMGHVGDSRLYLVRDGRFDQMSSDQTIAAELARLGVIERDRVEYHPHAHVLTQSLGSQPSVIPETLEFEVCVEDVLVLATDGLNPVVRLGEPFLDAIETDVKASAANLIAAANAEGGRDNTSVVVVRRTGGTHAVASLPDMLRSAAIFRGISAPGLLRLAQGARLCEFAEGDALMRAGESTDSLVVLVEGNLEWSVGDACRTLGPGEAIGFSAVLGARRSPGDLVGKSGGTALVLGAEEFARLTRRRKRLGNLLLRSIARQLAEMVSAGDDGAVQLGF